MRQRAQQHEHLLRFKAPCVAFGQPQASFVALEAGFGATPRWPSKATGALGTAWFAASSSAGRGATRRIS